MSGAISGHSVNKITINITIHIFMLLKPQQVELDLTSFDMLLKGATSVPDLVQVFGLQINTTFCNLNWVVSL